MPESSFDTTIEREKVEQLAENIRASVDEVTELLDADEIEIEKLLEVTRFIARSARRISRRANWTVGEPQPGNERDPKPRSGGAKKDDRGRSDEARGPRGGGGRGRDDRSPRGGGRPSAGDRSGGARSDARSGGRGGYHD